jgi:hypothetical protein
MSAIVLSVSLRLRDGLPAVNTVNVVYLENSSVLSRLTSLTHITLAYSFSDPESQFQGLQLCGLLTKLSGMSIRVVKVVLGVNVDPTANRDARLVVLSTDGALWMTLDKCLSNEAAYPALREVIFKINCPYFAVWKSVEPLIPMYIPLLLSSPRLRVVL